ncbi:MAG TPA: hypothetical protein VM166_05475 [Gemmatimonadaceae bacterium]|nr:hypothetical protein [Gemmatimonadaceae bacterium]
MKLRILAFLLLTATTACSESVATPVDAAIGGYMLTAVNGKPLPATVTASGDIISSTAVTGSIFLDKNGTYTGITEFRIVRAAATTIEPYNVPDGVWQRKSNTELTLLPNSGTDTNVRVFLAGDLLTYSARGLTYQYTRR